MHRTALAIGIVLILGAVFLLSQGTQQLIPIAEAAGLTSHYVKESVILPPTLFSVPPSNYTSATANLNPGTQVKGSLQVASERQVAFYVMNEGNFSLWREKLPSVVLLAQPIAISYNFTFTPPAPGLYFFIFDNQDNSARSLIFTLNMAESVTVLSPFVQYGGYELLMIGAALSYLSSKGGRKEKTKEPSPAPVVSGWRCRFCGTVNPDATSQFCSSCERSRE